MKPLSYYTTCENCETEGNGATDLEGVGQYDKESNTPYALPCPKCGEALEVSDWLDECEECGELHYEADGCEK